MRTQEEGGDLSRRLSACPTYEALARPEMIILVHGFNNNTAEAAQRYHGFRVRQIESNRSLDPKSLEKILTDTLWPGDAKGWFGWKWTDYIANHIVYPESVTTAKEAGPLLAKYLRSLPNLIKVHFIGHSLGCRLILEAINDIRKNGGPQVKNVCLMAPAVPVFEVQPNGSLEDAMNHIQKEILVLYSPHDETLRKWFPVGESQKSTPEGRAHVVALGLHTPPPNVAGKEIKSVQITGAKHSDYWGDIKNKASAQAHEEIRDYFKFSTYPKREIRSCSLNAAKRSFVSRSVAPVSRTV